MTKKVKTAAKRPIPTQIHELKIVIKNSKPPIWRTVAVPSDIRLYDLHKVIQAAFGWENYHLHQFILNKKKPKPTNVELAELIRSENWEEFASRMTNQRFFSLPMFELEDIEDERKIRLSDLVPMPKQKLEYEYDFGDSWKHIIEVKKVEPPAGGVTYPICLDGKLACPPEDCGGVWGYYDILEAVKDPRHPQHEDLKEWLGKDFDPDYFDLARTNAILAKVRLKP